MRRGFSLLGIVFLVAALAAAAARADGGTTTTDTTTTTTTTDTTTTSTTTTETTTTTSAPTYVPLVRSSLPKGCVGAGVAAIAEPGAVFALKLTGAGVAAYPASHPILTVDGAAVSGSTCQTGRATLRNVSLFGGAVTATSVAALDGKGTVTGLRVGGSSVGLRNGQTVAVGSWGLLTLGATSGRLSAPLALRLRYQHDSLPAGTTIYLAFAARAQARAAAPPHTTGGRHHRHRHARRTQKPHVPQPLTVVPKLGFGARHYVFPVDTGASFADTYGAGRNDIYDGWHHGDDLFAPLGTPIAAVATGKLTLVGWNELGGWRLWVTDAKGNSFYYAHLAGYSRYILHHRRVKAGQIIGFLGRTGDAFTTAPHLHFEIHPQQFLSLGYDGAVDPTSYLKSWRVEHLPESKIPAAARLPAPAGTPSQESAIVWGELLRARHLMPDGMPVVARTPSLRRSFPAAKPTPQFIDARRLASSRLAGDAGSAQDGPWPAITLAVLVVLAAAGSVGFRRRRRSA